MYDDDDDDDEAISLQNQPPSFTQACHPSVGRHSEYQRKLGSKQEHHAMH